MTISECKDSEWFCSIKFRQLIQVSFLQCLVNTILAASEGVIVSFFCHEIGLSVLGVLGPLTQIFNFLGLFFLSGCRLIYSREIGKNNAEKASEYFSCAMTIAFFVTGFLFLFALFGGPLFLDRYALSETLRLETTKYFNISRFFYALCPIVTFLGQMVFVDGDTKTCHLDNVVVTVIRLGLGILLTAMYGITGFAWASLISIIVSLLILSSHFLKQENSLKYRFFFSPAETLELIRYGLMDSSFYFFAGLNGALINSFLLSRFGESIMPVTGVVGQANGLTAILAANSQAFLPLFEVYEGERNYDGMNKIRTVTIKSIIKMGGLLTVLVFLAAPLFPKLYSISSPTDISYCVQGVRIISIPFILEGLLSFTGTYYNALGKNVLMAVLMRIKDTLFHFIFFVGGGYLFGVTGLWVGILLSKFATAIVFYLAIRHFVGTENILLLPDPEKEIKSWDIKLTQENVVRLRDEVAEYLKTLNKDISTINASMLFLEESYMSLLNRNAGLEVYSELTRMEDEKAVTLIIRDNGKLMPQSEDDSINSLTDYVLGTLLEKINKKQYMTVVAYNRRIMTLDK